jgi:AraC-like DNA-binding protein
VRVLDEILTSLRLTGGVVVDASAYGDWCMISHFSARHYGRYFSVPETLIAYHYVRAGEVWAEVEGQPRARAGEGSVIVLPRNDRHLLYTRAGLPPVDGNDLLQPGENGAPASIRIRGEGRKSEIYCGFLGLGDYKHPLLESLPPLLVLDGADPAREWIASSMQFLSSDQSPEMIARLAQLFIAHAIDRYIESCSGDGVGWVAGLKDPTVARALGLIHSRYAEHLGVGSLAREVGVSRSLLGKRFAELIGEPPMRYCARWRMRVAANMLRDGKANSANIAHAVGFNSEAAFSRAFKREFGDPPITWRRNRFG